MTVIIGIDPHKASHMAVAIDDDERTLGSVRSGGSATDATACWRGPRRWGRSERGRSSPPTGSASCCRRSSSPRVNMSSMCRPTLAARVRLLGSSKATKNDSNDALSTAIAGLASLWAAQPSDGDDHTTVLRLLVGRYDDLVAARTQAACRLHAVLRELVAGGAPRRLSADRATKLLRRVRPDEAVGSNANVSRLDLLGDVRRLDRDLSRSRRASGRGRRRRRRRCSRLHGVGPIVAGLILAHVGDPARFATPARFAAYNGTAPIEASSGPRKRHRLNPRGNRKLNHAMHLIAVTQIAHDTPGRVYYDRKLAEGKTKKEALRALKRRISDAVWRQLQVDLTTR